MGIHSDPGAELLDSRTNRTGHTRCGPVWRHAEGLFPKW